MQLAASNRAQDTVVTSFDEVRCTSLCPSPICDSKESKKKKKNKTTCQVKQCFLKFNWME